MQLPVLTDLDPVSIIALEVVGDIETTVALVISEGGLIWNILEFCNGCGLSLSSIDCLE